MEVEPSTTTQPTSMEGHDSSSISSSSSSVSSTLSTNSSQGVAVGGLKRKRSKTVRFDPDEALYQQTMKKRGIAATQRKKIQVKTQLEENIRKRIPSQFGSRQLTPLPRRAPAMFKSLPAAAKGNSGSYGPPLNPTNPPPVLWTAQDLQRFIRESEESCQGFILGTTKSISN
jgi:hypothetical protein